MRFLAILLPLFAAAFPAWALESEPQRAEFSSARLLVGEKRVEEKDGATVATLDAGVEITLTDGWKTYWRSPGDAGFPLEVAKEAGAANIRDITLYWPYPHRFVEEWGLEVFGFKERLLVPLTLTLEDAAADTQVDVTVSYAVCSDICINEQQRLSVLVPADYESDGIHARSLGKARADVPLENGSHGMTIADAAIRSEDREKGVLAVTVAREEGRFRAPELFVESATAGLRFPQAEVERGDDPLEVVLAVPYEISPPAKTLGGDTVTLTLVDGGKAIEHRLTVAAAKKTPIPLPLALDYPVETQEAPVPAEEAPLHTMLLLALLGGLVLNIMPCVLPVLSVKLLGAVKHGGGNTREVRQSFLATTAGILVFFLLLAGLTIAAKQAGQAVGWGFHFQSPQFLTFLAVLILLFAANLMGWFEIRLPAWLNTHIYDVTETGALKHRHHLAGDFSTGLFAALMATPCTAPFLGTAVGFALARGETEIVTIFLALGVGLALPYLAAALFPGLATRLPKPGAWMVRVKQVMGLLLLAAAAWLLWVIAEQAGAFVALGVLLLSLLLGAVLHGGGRWRFLRRRGIVAAVCAVLLATLALLPSLRLSPYQEKAVEAESAELWQRFDRVRIAEEVAAGRVVFVDVTADWCLTCKFNKLRVLDREDVVAALSAEDVVALRADMTRPMPDIQTYLKEYGRYGIPFNIVYGPAAPEGIPLPEVLGVEPVLDALSRAREAAK